MPPGGGCRGLPAVRERHGPADRAPLRGFVGLCSVPALHSTDRTSLSFTGVRACDRGRILIFNENVPFASPESECCHLPFALC